jgi:CpXC protein
MSRWIQVETTCPRCGAQATAATARSVNLRRHPHALAALAEERFDRVVCAGCKSPFYLDHQLLIVDVEAGWWCVRLPRAQRDDHAARAAAIRATIERYVESAPVAVAPRCAVRVVFDAGELGEAVRVWRADLEPELVECAKLTLLRKSEGGAPLALLFERHRDGALEFSWRDRATGAAIGEVALHDEVLGYIARHRASYQRALPEVFMSPYVSLRTCLADDAAVGHREATAPAIESARC